MVLTEVHDDFSNVIFHDSVELNNNYTEDYEVSYNDPIELIVVFLMKLLFLFIKRLKFLLKRVIRIAFCFIMIGLILLPLEN